MRNTLLSLSLLAVIPAAQAALISENFGAYANGDLVGQNGWTQTGSATASPIQVLNGQVTWAGGATADEQDAYLPFSGLVSQPGDGTASLYVGLKLSVASAGSNPSYFFALDGALDASSFENSRIVARDIGGTGFEFGVRVNGQGGYPFAYGGAPALSYGVTYNLVAKIDLNAGNANDTISLFVNPTTTDLGTLTPYATAAYNTGTVTDPVYGAAILSQFGSGSVNKAGVAFDQVVVSLDAGDLGVIGVPEPTTGALVLGGLGVLGYLKRRRATAA